MYLIITKRIWDKRNFLNLNNKKFKVLFTLNKKKIQKFRPKIIFFIHWSKKISANFLKKNLCIQFHSSDLPRFRGGSPIQNQIINQVKNTKISAFKMNDIIDGGDICIKEKLKLSGSAETIYKNMEKKCVHMIKKISKRKKVIFYKQKGKASFYKRRSDKDSNLKLNELNNFSSLYDFIRMLDADGYPNAFLKLKKFKIIFNDAKLEKKCVSGKFKIIK